MKMIIQLNEQDIRDMLEDRFCTKDIEITYPTYEIGPEMDPVRKTEINVTVIQKYK